MKGRTKHLILFIILLVIDQATKYWVRTVLVNRDPVIIIPDVLNLQYHTNTGAVWGMLSGKVVYLSIFTFIVLLLITYLYFKIPEGKKYNILKIIVVFIMAGAVGNLIDRVFLGHVIDFIYFELINFPLFNFADSCLTVSSILLFILAMFYFKDEDFAFLDQIFRGKKAKNLTDSKQAEAGEDKASEKEAEDEADNKADNKAEEETDSSKDDSSDTD